MIDLKRQCLNNFEIDFSHFISITEKGGKKGSQNLRKLENNIKKLKIVFDKLVLCSRTEMPKNFTFALNNPNMNYSPQAKYCFTKLQKLQRKYQFNHEVFFSKAASSISTILFSLEDCLKQNNCDLMFDTYSVENYIESTFNTNPSILWIQKKIRSLDLYSIRKFKYTPNISMIYENRMKTALQESSRLVNASQKYSPFTSFDSLLEIYINKTKNTSLFEKASISILESKTTTASENHRNSIHMPKAMSKSKSLEFGLKKNDKDSKKQAPKKVAQYSLDLSFLDNLEKFICEKLNVKSVLSQIIIENSVIRIVFDKIAILYPEIIMGTSDISEFEHKCNVIRWATPRNLKISPNIINKADFDTPFATLASRSADLQKASAKLQIIHFYNNPIDIINLIFESIRCIESYVQNNNLESRLGQYISMIDMNSLAPKNNSMSFDDFFSVFWPTFALNPSSNCIAVSSLLASINEFRFSSSFDFTRLMFSSAVEYTMNVNLKELMPQHFIDSANDPLNII